MIEQGTPDVPAASLGERLQELHREYEVGQRRLHELLAQEVAVRETLLRIAGAIQVLAEFTGESAEPLEADQQPAPDGAPAARPPAPGTPLRVG